MFFQYVARQATYMEPFVIIFKESLNHWHSYLNFLLYYMPAD